jgi:hypothetical protein
MSRRDEITGAFAITLIVWCVGWGIAEWMGVAIALLVALGFAWVGLFKLLGIVEKQKRVIEADQRTIVGQSRLMQQVQQVQQPYVPTLGAATTTTTQDVWGSYRWPS